MSLIGGTPVQAFGRWTHTCHEMTQLARRTANVQETFACTVHRDIWPSHGVAVSALFSGPASFHIIPQQLKVLLMLI